MKGLFWGALGFPIIAGLIVGLMTLTVEYDPFGIRNMVPFLNKSGTWTPTPRCQLDLEALKTKPGAAAFAVGREGLCGFGFGKSEVKIAKEVALTYCAEAGGVECKVISFREADYTLNDECKRHYAERGALEKAVAFAAGKSGECGYIAGTVNLEEAKSQALAKCREHNGVDCKITYVREGYFTPGANCTESIAKLREAQAAFVVAVHAYGDCVAMEVKSPAARAQNERDVVAACNHGIGTECKLYASE